VAGAEKPKVPQLGLASAHNGNDVFHLKVIPRAAPAARFLVHEAASSAIPQPDLLAVNRGNVVSVFISHGLRPFVKARP
jgi:hypothetical protein